MAERKERRAKPGQLKVQSEGQTTSVRFAVGAWLWAYAGGGAFGALIQCAVSSGQ